MIFITLGSQKFQFNRLLKVVDGLIEKGVINEPVFAQTGASNYIPKTFKSKAFLSREEFEEKLLEASLILTHGGSGAIVTALKAEKKIIALPRLEQYGEHVDDHQVQIVESFAEMNYLLGLRDEKNLGIALEKMAKLQFEKFESNNERFIKDISAILEDKK